MAGYDQDPELHRIAAEIAHNVPPAQPQITPGRQLPSINTILSYAPESTFSDFSKAFFNPNTAPLSSPNPFSVRKYPSDSPAPVYSVPQFHAGDYFLRPSDEQGESKRVKRTPMSFDTAATMSAIALNPNLAVSSPYQSMAVETYSQPPEQPTQRKRKRTKANRSDFHCHQCGTKSTPEWRKGPDGPSTLCNACGLQYSKKLREEKKRLDSMQQSPNQFMQKSPVAISPAPHSMHM